MRTDIIIAASALTIAYLANASAFWAGYHIRPSLVFIDSVKFLVPITAVMLLFVRMCRAASSPLLFGVKMVICGICLLPFMFSGFRTERGLEGFSVRIMKELDQQQLETWIQRFRATNTQSFMSRQLSSEDLDALAPTGWDLPPPRILVSPHLDDIRLIWGTGFGGWAVVHGTEQQHSRGLYWGGNLRFTSHMK